MRRRSRCALVPEKIVTRVQTIALSDLAARFDSMVAEARERSGAAEPESVRNFRDQLAQRLQAALGAIADGFFGYLKHWKELGAAGFLLFSIIGYVYALLLYGSFGIFINPYLSGIEDLALIGFLKGGRPLTILLVLAIYIMFIHHAARAIGSRLVDPKRIRVARSKEISLLIFLHRPTVLFGVALVAALAIFGNILLQALQPGPTAGEARLQLRLAGDQMPIEIAGLIGSTANYLFVELPVGEGEPRQGIALARAKVDCIGPRRLVAKQKPTNYGVPPCDAIRNEESAGTTTPPSPLSPPPGSIEGYRRLFAKALGCDVDSRRAQFYETPEFPHGKDDAFECPAGLQSCTADSQRAYVRAGLLDLLSKGMSAQDDAAFIAGFASSRAPATYNLDLSERRAAFVHALIGGWPAHTRERGFGEHDWTEALQAPNQKAVLVVVCKRAPREDVPSTIAIADAGGG